MTNPNFIPMTVDGTDVAVIWHDFGSFRRLSVFQNDKLIGKKNFPIPVDTGVGTIEWAVKSILRGRSETSAQL